MAANQAKAIFWWSTFPLFYIIGDSTSDDWEKKCSNAKGGSKLYLHELSGSSHYSSNNSQLTPEGVLPHFPLNNGMHCSGSEPGRQ